MKRRLTLALALAALCATGTLAALTLAPAAFAWSPDNLPPGFSTSHTTDANPASTCPSAYRIYGAGTFSDNYCESSPTYQQDFDAWVNAHYTPPPSTTAPTTAALPPATTTVVITTPTPADATTTPTDTTAPAPAPGAPAATTTTVVTVVTTATPVEQSLQAQIDALSAQIAALTTRVTRLEKAGDASWLAFQQSVAKGDTPDVAAGIARGTWLNVVNGLGAFAP